MFFALDIEISRSLNFYFFLLFISIDLLGLVLKILSHIKLYIAYLSPLPYHLPLNLSPHDIEFYLILRE